MAQLHLPGQEIHNDERLPIEYKASLSNSAGCIFKGCYPNDWQ